MARKSPKRLVPKLKMADAVHLIRGDSAGGTLRHGGARFIVCIRDTLAYGPSSAEPQKHRRVRNAFWTEVSGLDVSDLDDTPTSAHDVESAARAFSSGLPVVVWSGENWSDRLFLWWALDALSRTSLADRPVWLASPVCVPGWDFLESMACYNPEQMQRMFGHAQRLGPWLSRPDAGDGAGSASKRRRGSRNSRCPDSLGSA